MCAAVISWPAAAAAALQCRHETAREGKVAPVMSDTAHILVVDDQHEICDVVQEYLTGEGYRVSVAHDGGGMRRALSQSTVDLVVLDLMLPGEDGLTLARSLRGDSSSIGIIILTG